MSPSMVWSRSELRTCRVTASRAAMAAITLFSRLRRNSTSTAVWKNTSRSAKVKSAVMVAYASKTKTRGVPRILPGGMHIFC